MRTNVPLSLAPLTDSLGPSGLMTSYSTTGPILGS